MREKIEFLRKANAQRRELLAELSQQIPKHRDYKYTRIQRQIEKIRLSIQAADDLITDLERSIDGEATSLSRSST